MRFFTTTPIFLLLALALTSTQGQNAPASAAASTPAAAKPADKKDEPTKVDAKTTAAPTAAAKPAAAAATDAKKPADASNKTGAAPAVANTKLDAKKPASGAAPAAAAASSTSADDGSSAKTAKAEGPPCVVAEFREIGIDEQDVTKRRTRALSWLQQRAKQCSVEQLLMIRNNRSQWMGTADSARLASVVDSLLEAIAAENPRVAALLYGTPPPPSADEKK